MTNAHGFGAGRHVAAEVAPHGRGDGDGAGLLDAAHRHAEVLGLDHDEHALGAESGLDGVGDLAGEALLHLGAAGVAVDQAGELRQAGDAAVVAGDVGEVGPADERHEVVLAQRREGDVAHQDHLVVMGLEGDLEVMVGVLEQPAEDLGVHGGDALGRALQAVAVGILADGDEDLPHRLLDAEAGPWSRRPTLGGRRRRRTKADARRAPPTLARIADDSLLVMNAGSSSLKYSLYAASPAARGPSCRPRRDRRARPRRPGRRRRRRRAPGWPATAAARRQPSGTGWCTAASASTTPVLIDDDVLAALDALVPLAPLHQPPALAVIRALQRTYPDATAVACFDTAFHRTQPWVATAVALPRALTATGIRRYGFHGLSYEYIVSALPAVAPELVDARVVVAHLGNGASMCAVDHGRSVATTMGFTALDGLVMGTRPGTLDPGVLLYLMDAGGMDAAALTDVLYHRVGPAGRVRGGVRRAHAAGQPRARRLRRPRPVRLPGGARAGLAGRRPRGDRRVGLHGRHRRARARHPGPHRRGGGVAGRRDSTPPPTTPAGPASPPPPARWRPTSCRPTRTW